MDQLAHQAAGGHIAQRNGNPSLAVVPGHGHQNHTLTPAGQQNFGFQINSGRDVVRDMMSDEPASLGAGFQDLFRSYKGTLPSSSPEVFSDKMQMR